MKKKTKSILSLFTLFTFIFLNIPKITKADTQVKSEKERVNFALSGTATASNTEAGQESVWGPDKTIDGIINRDTLPRSQQSRWSTDVGNVERVLTVDLNSEKTFDEFNIEWERLNIKNFNIKVSSNNSDFIEVYNKSDNINITDLKTNIKLNESVTGRYVKLFITGYDGGELNWPSVSIYEFEIIGDLVEDLEEEVDPTVNIALNKPATASSIEASTLTANKAVDGLKGRNSRWASSVRSNEEWLRVDLGSKSKIKTVIIDWERRNATSYEIQVSDNDSTWTTVKSIDLYPKYVNDKIVLDNVVEGRYIRILIKTHALADQVSGGVEWNNVSIEEFSVYSGDLEDTLEDVVKTIQVPAIGKDDEKLTMPKVPTGFNIEFVGADYEQVIGRDLTIYKPIVDTTVTVTFKISKGNTALYTQAIPVKVPGLYKVEEGRNAKPVVIPEIREWVGSDGNFEITNSSRILIDPQYKNELMEMANIFAEDYKDITNNKIEVIESNSLKAGDIYITLDTADKGLGEEGHLMTISDYIKVEAEDRVGAYWATISILQILKQNGTTLPQGLVRDYPKYEVRGFMLDVGRMEFSMDYLYETMKNMAWYKMNDFQVHLNDNYIFLEEYSNAGEDPMNAYSGFRLESDIKKGGNNGLNKADLTNTDTFYTKLQFKQFIKDARARGVDIVPEFDTPAHSLPFTKVRPDLKMGSWGRQADHLDVTNPESLKFVKNLWDEYLNGSDPVFDSETIVNIGTDEYDAKYTEQFRKFTDDLLGYIQDEKGRTVRLWGSLTARPGKTPVRSENVQMNIWNTGWANPKDMFNAGYDLINMVDGTLYIVPAAGYYYDYLYKNSIYNSWQPNVMGGTEIPAGHEQMLGSSYAVWNDMIDKRSNGMTEYDIFDRFFDVLPAYSSKVWGNGSDLTFAKLEEKSDIIGEAPNTNLSNNIDSKTNDVLNLLLDNDKDVSGNGYDIKDKVNSSIEEVDGRNALKLNGDKSYAETELSNIGMGSVLQFKVKKNAGDNSEQILFESEEGAIKAVQVGTGNVGFSRAGRDFSFNYKLPDNEWVELAFRNVKDQTSLYVNGKLVQTIGETATGTGKIHATFNLPLTRIGSETKAFNGYVDDVRVIKGNVQLPTLDLVNLIAETKDFIKEDYTIDSWTALENSILEAKDILVKLNANQQDIDNAMNKIKEAIKALEEKGEEPVQIVNKTELQALYNENKDKENKNYTEDSWIAFKTALEKANTIINNNEATQEEVDRALSELEKAINALEEKNEEPVQVVNKSELQALYNENKDKENKNYTEDSWTAFETALEKANTIINNNEVTQEEVDRALSDLQKAIKALEEKGEEPVQIVNKTKLQTLYNENKDKEKLNYTEASWNIFNKALSEGKLVLDNEEATQEEVDKVISDLEKSIESLKEVKEENPIQEPETPVEKVNKDNLQKLYNENKNKEKESYTEASWNVFNKSLNEAKSILNNKEATQEEVNKVLSDLENSIKALKEKTKDNDIKQPGDNSSEGGSGSNNTGKNNLPQTGGNNSRLVLLFGLVLIAFGLFFVYDKRLNKKITK